MFCSCVIERVAVTSANALLTPKQLEYKYYAESFNRTDVMDTNTSKRHITVKRYNSYPQPVLPFYIPETYKLSTLQTHSRSASNRTTDVKW